MPSGKSCLPDFPLRYISLWISPGPGLCPEEFLYKTWLNPSTCPNRKSIGFPLELPSSFGQLANRSGCAFWFNRISSALDPPVGSWSFDLSLDPAGPGYLVDQSTNFAFGGFQNKSPMYQTAPQPRYGTPYRPKAVQEKLDT